MSRFTLKKKRQAQHGWKPHLLELAKEKYGDFAPDDVHYNEFLEQLVDHHLAEIHRPYQNQ